MATRSLCMIPTIPSSPLSHSNNASHLSIPNRRLLHPPPTATTTAGGFNSADTSPHLLLASDEHPDRAALIRGQKQLRDLSSWGIGGPCRFFLAASCASHLTAAVRYCRAAALPLLIVGKGSNCLFDDRGFDGLVVLNRLDRPGVEVVGPGAYRVGSGYPFNRLGVRCSIDGFSGLEFAAGIPGTVGGAAFMNAGAHGQETGAVIESVEIVTAEGEVRTLGRGELVFGYRRSSFQEMTGLAAILTVTFRLTPDASARERQKAFLERRRKTQPIGERSAGSVFRNPIGLEISAGELIELAGLKGFELGGAKISQTHANFFINNKGSTCRDMLALIYFVKEKVDQMFGIQLKEEIKYIPYTAT